MMAKKFKVGDKVRYIEKGGWFPVGAILYVIKAEDIGEMNHMLSESIDGKPSASSSLWVNEDEIELVEAKPSKNERISLLESQVAELQAKVEALQKRRKPAVALTQAPKSATEMVLDAVRSEHRAMTLKKLRTTPNQQRKAVIERAKAFVERPRSLRGRRVKYVIDEGKRTVVALLYGISDKFAMKVVHKAIAKCAPDDVFNADIGKAIALGRALGLDVSEFENAVKPTEVVQYHVINSARTGKYIVTPGVENERIHNMRECGIDSPAAFASTIIDDTKAKY